MLSNPSCRKREYAEGAIVMATRGEYLQIFAQLKIKIIRSWPTIRNIFFKVSLQHLLSISYGYADILI